MMVKGSTSNYKACAACKYQRRRCTPDCPLAPYFPADQSKKFQDVHRLYGVSKITKLLKHLSDDQKDEAMKSIIFESEMRRRFPVQGCLGILCTLKEELKQSQIQLDSIKTLIASFRKKQCHDRLGILESSDDDICRANFNRNHHPSQHLYLKNSMDFIPDDGSLGHDLVDQEEAKMHRAKQFLVHKPQRQQEAYNDTNLNGVRGSTLYHPTVHDQEANYDDMPLDAIADDSQEACDSSAESSLEDPMQLTDLLSRNELKIAAACFALTSVNY